MSSTIVKKIFNRTSSGSTKMTWTKMCRETHFSGTWGDECEREEQQHQFEIHGGKSKLSIVRTIPQGKKENRKER